VATDPLADLPGAGGPACGSERRRAGRDTLGRLVLTARALVAQAFTGLVFGRAAGLEACATC